MDHILSQTKSHTTRLSDGQFIQLYTLKDSARKIKRNKVKRHQSEALRSSMSIFVRPPKRSVRRFKKVHKGQSLLLKLKACLWSL